MIYKAAAGWGFYGAGDDRQRADLFVSWGLMPSLSPMSNPIAIILRGDGRQASQFNLFDDTSEDH